MSFTSATRRGGKLGAEADDDEGISRHRLLSAAALLAALRRRGMTEVREQP